MSGSLLLFTKGVHWEAKTLLKQLALTLKSDSSLPSVNIGGIIGIFLPLLNVLRID